VVDFVVQIDADGNGIIIREFHSDKILSNGKAAEAKFARVIRPGCGNRGVLSAEEINSDAFSRMGIVFEIDMSADSAALSRQRSR
jgi:hypothetical protein